MNRIHLTVIFLIIIQFLSVYQVTGYPLDGYPYSGIRRLEYIRLVNEGKLKGSALPEGARKSINDIQLHLKGDRGEPLAVLPPVDPGLQKNLDTVFTGSNKSYAVAVLDITPGQPFRLATRNMKHNFAPGSVGKLAIAAGLFNELKRLYPDSTEKRLEILKTRMVIGGEWVIYDHHTIPHFDPETGKYFAASPRKTDVFSLFEWLDHMLSPSANAAASVVWKEAILMKHFGKNYPPTIEQEQDFFRKTPRKEMVSIVMSVVNDPLRQLGIVEKDWRLGNLFTRMGKKLAPGAGGSTATPHGILQFMIALERGKLVDEWSSREIKRLMYMTGRRIRYASSPALAKSAVYFKSGSQYKCKKKPGFTCKKYHGNVYNYMNSVAIVEHPGNKRIYIVVLMSNVLGKNSAVDHQTIATYIDRIIAKPYQ